MDKGAGGNAVVKKPVNAKARRDKKEPRTNRSNRKQEVRWQI